MTISLKEFLAPLGIPEDLKRQILEIHGAEVKAAQDEH